MEEGGGAGVMDVGRESEGEGGREGEGEAVGQSHVFGPVRHCLSFVRWNSTCRRASMFLLQFGHGL